MIHPARTSAAIPARPRPAGRATATLAGTTIAALVLSILAAVHPAAAAEPTGPAADVQSLQHLHAEELAAFAVGLDARENSLANDVRAQAMALAKKLDPALHVREAPRKAMTTEEALADKADRETALAHAKDREAAEGYSATAVATTTKDGTAAPPDDAGGDPYPPPEDLPARFAAMRFEILAREIDFVTALDSDPDDRAAAATRAVALKMLLGLVGTPHWACERHLKSEITAAIALKDPPWSGVFASDHLDFITLVQKGERITGSWAAKPDTAPLGDLALQLRGRTATGAWKSASGEEGTVTLVLHCDGKTLTGETTGGGETHQVHGVKTANVLNDNGK